MHPATRTLPSSPDGNLFLWTIGWNVHAFVHQPFAIFDANMYFPQAHTLAYSENLIGSAMFAAPVVWLTGNLALGLNVVALLSVVLCGTGTYVLARRLGVRPAFAIIAGIVFAFSPPRFFRLGQAHLTVVQWIPFGLAFLHSYLDSPSPGLRGTATSSLKRGASDLRWAIACFTMQALSSGHGAVFFAVAAMALVAYKVALGTPLELPRRLRDVGVTGALLLVPVALMAIPYRAVQVEMGLRRSLADWGVAPESFIASPSHLWSSVLARIPGAEHVNETADAFLFPGVLPIVLAIAAVAGRRAATRTTIFYAVLTLLGLWLAIGPPLGLWQFIYWIPGLNFIRECSRFTILAMLGLAVLAGFGAERLARRLAPARAGIVAAVLGVALLAEFAAFPLATSEYRGGDIPAADRWLATQPGPFAVAEVPLPNPQHAGPFERAQTQYLLHSAAHWQKTVHGYSGIRPPLHEALYPALRGFPNDESLAALARIGVNFVVVHVDQYRARRLAGGRSAAAAGHRPRVARLLGSRGTRLQGDRRAEALTTC